MRNQDVSKALDEMAALLELKGESTFRIRAYENASRAVSNLTEDVEQVATGKQLTKIKGIGSGIAERITELLDTGRIAYLEELRAEFPDGVRQLMDVPGIGPSLARRVHTELHVQNLDDLRRVAEDGSLASLSGLGEKSAQNVLRGLERVNKRDHRISIGTALPVVEELIAELQDAPLSNLAAAGSLRRWAPTIGDIDLMATSEDPDTVMQRFIHLPRVSQVLAHGSTKSSVVLDNGLQIDLRIVRRESFGALLQHFTGSKDHNVELREYSLHRGLSLNEYGIADVATGVRTQFEDEHAFYAALGLQYIEPEMRQGTGEIQAAQAGSLPTLVSVSDIRGDLHAHSNWSDGAFPIEEMVEAARSRGYEYMALTDHSGGIGVAGGLHADRLMAQLEIVGRLNESLTGFQVLKGSEVDIKRNGELDFPDDVLAQLDWVIASVHSGFNQTRDEMTARILSAMHNPHVDAIAHPTGRLIGKREPYDVDMERVFAAAAETGTVLEINSFPDRLDLDGTLARRALECGVTLVINTDAHAPIHFSNIRYGVATARRGWVEPRNVLNTLPLRDLKRRLKNGGQEP